MGSTGSKRRKLQKPYKKSAEWVAEDNDLMTEILLHLPVESIIKFKRVSKRIRSLVSSYWFARRFHQLSLKKTNPFGLFIYKDPYYQATLYLSLNDTDGNRRRVRVPGNFPKDKIDILQSCNGLFLCTSDYQSIRIPATRFLVCNAAIKQSVRITHPGWKSGHSLSGLALAFDPLRSPEYKVVALWQSLLEDSRTSVVVEVYSSAAGGSWRAAKGGPLMLCQYLRYYDCYHDGFYHSGTIYWLVLGKPKVISFDLDEECLNQFELPPRPSREHDTVSIRYFGTSGDCLQLIDEFEMQYFVYQKKTDSPDWLVKYVIHLNDINSCSFSDDIAEHLDTLKSSALSIVPGEGDEEMSLIIALPDKIIRYSPENKTTKLLRDKNSPGSRTFFKTFKWNTPRWRHIFQYYETIYPLSTSYTYVQE